MSPRETAPGRPFHATLSASCGPWAGSTVRVRFCPLRSCRRPPSMLPRDVASGRAGLPAGRPAARRVRTPCGPSPPVRSCSSRVPCDRLRRKTSTPTAISPETISGFTGRRAERCDDLGASHWSQELADQSRSRPLTNSSASLHLSAGTRSAMSPRPKRSSGQSDVSTTSNPACSTWRRHAFAVSRSSKSRTTSQSSKRESSTCSSEPRPRSCETSTHRTGPGGTRR